MGDGSLCPFRRGRPYLPGQSGRSGLEEGGIEPESADECDGLSQRLAAVQESERRVSPIGHYDYAPGWAASVAVV